MILDGSKQTFGPSKTNYFGDLQNSFLQLQTYYVLLHRYFE